MKKRQQQKTTKKEINKYFTLQLDLPCATQLLFARSRANFQEIVKSGIGSTLNARLMGADKCEERGGEERERETDTASERARAQR